MGLSGSIQAGKPSRKCLLIRLISNLCLTSVHGLFIYANNITVTA